MAGCAVKVKFSGGMERTSFPAKIETQHIGIQEGDCMRYPWIDEYLLQKPAVEKDLQAEWNWIRYKVVLHTNF